MINTRSYRSGRHPRLRKGPASSGAVEGRELARWRCLAVGHEAMRAGRFPVGSFFFVSVVRSLRFQLPPVKPCVRTNELSAVLTCVDASRGRAYEAQSVAVHTTSDGPRWSRASPNRPRG